MQQNMLAHKHLCHIKSRTVNSKYKDLKTWVTCTKHFNMYVRINNKNNSIIYHKPHVDKNNKNTIASSNNNNYY